MTLTGHSASHPGKSRIANSMGKARILMEALPYIRAFRGATIVIKYGGAAMEDSAFAEEVAGDVTLLTMVGLRPVIVHGGGARISEAMRRQGVEPQWRDGLRVTDQPTMRIVQHVLVGEVNPELVRLLSRRGSTAIGMTGLDGAMFAARPISPDLGLVGEVTSVRTDLIASMLEDGVVPVVAPLGLGEDGRAYNLNADTAAGALAVALGAQKLVYLTDVEGVRRDQHRPETLISRMQLSELRQLLTGNGIGGGMRPKLASCVTALEGGVAQAHILDGRVQHALLLEIFTPEGVGTMVVP
jgi:acetylglutamate kinase